MSYQSLKETRCFFEKNPALLLSRRSFVEGVGSMLLMVAVTGAALTGQRISGGIQELGLVTSALATSGALVGLILAFGHVSGGHFNPLITALQWLGGERSLKCSVAYVTAQIAGAALGAGLANVLFGNAPSESLALTFNSRWVFSEIIAAFGLMTIVFGCIRSEMSLTAPFGVGAWLFAAIVATPSASYANPAIALAAIFATGPVSITYQTAISYVGAEIAGALLAYFIIHLSYPHTTE